MSQVPNATASQGTYKMSGEKKLCWAVIITGLALLLIGTSLMAVHGALDDGKALQNPDANPTNPTIQEYIYSPIAHLRTTLFLGFMGGGVVIGGFFHCMGGTLALQKASYNDRPWEEKKDTHLKKVRLFFAVAGLAIALFGISMAITATMVHNSSAFSDPDNLRFYPSQEAIDAMSTRLTTLTATGFTILPLAGAATIAIGFLPKLRFIPERMAEWLKARAQAKREALAAKKTETRQARL